MLFYFNCDLNAVCLSGLCVFSMQCHWHGLLSVSMVFSSHIPSFVYCDILGHGAISMHFTTVYTHGLGVSYCENCQLMSLFRRLFILI